MRGWLLWRAAATTPRDHPPQAQAATRRKPERTSLQRGPDGWSWPGFAERRWRLGPDQPRADGSRPWSAPPEPQATPDLRAPPSPGRDAREWPPAAHPWPPARDDPPQPRLRAPPLPSLRARSARLHPPMAARNARSPGWRKGRAHRPLASPARRGAGRRVPPPLPRPATAHPAQPQPCWPGLAIPGHRALPLRQMTPRWARSGPTGQH